MGIGFAILNKVRKGYEKGTLNQKPEEGEKGAIYTLEKSIPGRGS